MSLPKHPAPYWSDHRKAQVCCYKLGDTTKATTFSWLGASVVSSVSPSPSGTWCISVLKWHRLAKACNMKYIAVILYKKWRDRKQSRLQPKKVGHVPVPPRFAPMDPPFLIFWHSGTMAFSPERQSVRMSINWKGWVRPVRLWTLWGVTVLTPLGLKGLIQTDISVKFVQPVRDNA